MLLSLFVCCLVICIFLGVFVMCLSLWACASDTCSISYLLTFLPCLCKCRPSGGLIASTVWRRDRHLVVFFEKNGLRKNNVDFELSAPQQNMKVRLLCRWLWPGLCLASTTDYIKPRLSTKFRERAFSYAGPHAWNDLPNKLRSTTNATAFKKHPETHFSILFWIRSVFSLFILFII